MWIHLESTWNPGPGSPFLDPPIPHLNPCSRSAEFSANERTCILSRDDRRTQPEAFRSQPGWVCCKTSILFARPVLLCKGAIVSCQCDKGVGAKCSSGWLRQKKSVLGVADQSSIDRQGHFCHWNINHVILSMVSLDPSGCLISFKYCSFLDKILFWYCAFACSIEDSIHLIF